MAAVAVLALTLTGCAASPSDAPTPAVEETPIAVPSPIATPEPAASVPFDGDCTQALADEEVASLLGSAAVEPVAWTLSTIEPDLSASLALIGGLACNWRAGAGFLSIAVFPNDVVPSAVADVVGTVSCDDSGAFCKGATVNEGAWVYAHAGDEATAATALQRVSERVARFPRPHAETASTERWTLPACTDLTRTVEDASGVAGLQAGFPGDSVPWGVSWETAVANGVTAWCPWTSYSGADTVLIELDLQPGVGAPDEVMVAEASGIPIEVTGASQAFLVPNATGEGIARVVAVSGENRLSVTGGSGGTQDSLSAVATAVLAELDD
jgi:hypothetical protein